MVEAGCVKLGVSGFFGRFLFLACLAAALNHPSENFV